MLLACTGSDCSMYFVYLNRLAQLNIQKSDTDSVLDGGAQKQQIFNVECLSDFTEPPLLTLHFL